MIRRPPRSTLSSSSAASDVYKRQNPQAVRLLGPVAVVARAQLVAHALHQAGLLVLGLHLFLRRLARRRRTHANSVRSAPHLGMSRVETAASCGQARGASGSISVASDRGVLMPRTKIIATIGPASDSPEVLRALVD